MVGDAVQDLAEIAFGIEYPAPKHATKSAGSKIYFSMAKTSLNRVTQGGDNAHWGEQYAYDNWSNLYAQTVTRGSGYSFSVTPNGNNQLSNLTYDAAGEVTIDQLGNSFTYNAEGRIVTVGAASYTYDGDGNRVKKANGAGTTLYWPSSVSGVVDESNAGGTSFGRQIFLGGIRVWSEDTSGTGRFVFQDQVGSTRVTVSSAGSVEDDVDYRSFGNVVANYGAAPSDNHYVFTGYESDSADSSTDYAEYRNLSYSLARFNRPDPYLGSYDPSNPQSFNRYGYARNNPLTYIDPNGLIPCDLGMDDDGNQIIGDAYDAQGCADAGGSIVQYVETVTAGGNGSGNESVSITDAGVSTLIQTQSWPGAPSKLQQAMAYIQGVSDDVRNCINNVALPTIANDLNPFSPSVLGILQQGTSDLSQSSLQAAAYYSVTSGLTVPLRSSIVRAGMTNAEALGKLSFAISLLQVDAALLDAVIQEYKHC